MTTLITGPREVALAKLKGLTPRELVARDPSDTRLDAPTVNEAHYALWNERNRTHQIWMDPHPLWDPKDLVPSPGRHVIFPTTEAKKGKPTGGPNAKWKAWAKKHGIPLDEVSYPPRERRILALTSGKTGLKFTQDAAELLVDTVPGGYDELALPVFMLKQMEVPQPVTPADAALVCFGGAEVAEAQAILKALGTRKAIRLAVSVSEKKAYGGLKYFEAACRNQPNRLEYLDALFCGVASRRWTPWVALQLFCHLTHLDHQEKQSSSPSATRTSSSPTRPAFFHLSGIRLSPLTRSTEK